MSDRIAVLRAGSLVATMPARRHAKAHARRGDGRAPGAAAGREAARARRHRLRARPRRRARRARRRAPATTCRSSLRAGEIDGDRRRVRQRPGRARRRAVRRCARADAGIVTLGGRALPAEPRAWIAAGAARIPEDRRDVGTIGDLPVWENAIAERYRRPFASAGIVRRGAARAFAREAVRPLRRARRRASTRRRARCRAATCRSSIVGRALSGGAEREDRYLPALIVANQPTWGLDAGALAWVHQQLLDACARGAAVLLVSEDLDEILALADRIAVMHAGRLTPARARVRVDARGDRARDGGRRRARCGLRRAARCRPRCAIAAPLAAIACHARRRRAVRRLGRRAGRQDLRADLRRRLRLALRLERDADARDAADAHGARRGDRVPRAPVQHRRRGPALRGRARGGRGRRPARRRRASTCRLPLLFAAMVARRGARRRDADGAARVREDALRRRRGRDHAAAQLHRAAVRLDDARRPDEGPDRDGLAAERRAAGGARAAEARRAHARARRAPRGDRARACWRGRCCGSRRSASRCARSGRTRARRASPACRSRAR